MADSGPRAYGAKQLAADAIFCALILGFSLLFSSLAYLSRSVFGVLIAAMFGFYFTGKPLVRSGTAGAAMVLLMLFLQGVTLTVSVYLPNILGGIALSLALRNPGKVYYLISIPVLAAITAGEFLLVSHLMMGTTLFASLQETLSKYPFIQIPEADLAFYLICYFICFCLVMAGMKSVIADKICRILHRRVPQLDKLL